MKRRLSIACAWSGSGACRHQGLYSTERAGGAGWGWSGRLGRGGFWRRQSLGAEQQDRHLHEVPDAIGGRAVQRRRRGSGGRAWTSRSDRRSAPRPRRISSVAGSPIASRVVDREAAARRARRAAVEVVAVRLASPPTRAASARRSCAPPSRRRRAPAAARRRSAARARATCVEDRAVGGRVLDRDENASVHLARLQRRRLIQQPDVQRGDDNRDRPGQRLHPERAGELRPSCADRW